MDDVDNQDLNRGHQEIVEQLPDYAVGALDDAELDRIAGHLAGCPGCRRELGHVLNLVGRLGEVFPPARTRTDLLDRATERPPAESPAPPDLAVPPLAAPPARGETALRPVSSSGGGSVTPTPLAREMARRAVTPAPRARGRAAWGALAAAALLLAALGGWTLGLRQEDPDRSAIAALVDGATVSPLTDGDLFPTAAGVLFAEDDRRQALLVTDGLPPLPPDRRYQAWLFDDAGGRVAGPLFAPDADGHADVVVEAPEPFAAYAAVAVSAEPAAGSEAPTSALALGGWLR